jgi:Domain of unknown function (DUF5668)/B-box zinc finger
MNCAIHTEIPAAAFCRTCGKALCENCKRDVMGAIYCEPCIAARLQGSATPGIQPPVVPVTIVEGAPSPGLAAFLGFIPGVGAMYNGQFTKAFIHVVIFALLIVAVSNARGLEPLFGLMIPAFVFYMVFEAHQTAKARQLGRPLPDFLGLERMFGVHENHPVSPVTAPPSAVPPGERPPQPSSQERLPTGAIVLVGLGVFFLLQNLGLFHMHRMWPLLLIGFGLWIAYKRTAERV